jgi:hypothetical protein
MMMMYGWVDGWCCLTEEERKGECVAYTRWIIQ